MAKSRPETICLKGQFVMYEAIADSAMKPGQQVDYKAGDTSKIVLGKDTSTNTVAGRIRRKAFVLENDLLGKTIDDDYAADEFVRYGVFNAGCQLQGRVKAATAAITAGDRLLLDAGYVEKHGDASNQDVVAVALESVDNSAGADDVFIIMEIL